jgi:hypothetical protein
MVLLLPACSVSPPAVAVTAPFSVICPAACKVRLLALDQVSGTARVILPACVPALPASPVETVTFAPPSAVTNVPALITLLSVVAVKPAPVVCVSLEIVMLYGSSSSVPQAPNGARRSVQPV